MMIMFVFISFYESKKIKENEYKSKHINKAIS